MKKIVLVMCFCLVAGFAGAFPICHSNDVLLVAEPTLPSTPATKLYVDSLPSSEKEIIVLAGQDYITSQTGTVGLVAATNLQFTALAMKDYIVEGWLSWTTSATTVGINLAVDTPAYRHISGMTDSMLTANTAIHLGFMQPNNSGGPSTSAPWTSNNLSRMRVMFGCGATSGVVVVKFSAEVTGTVRIRGNSVLRVRQVN
jgi:hypothetical protein